MQKIDINELLTDQGYFPHWEYSYPEEAGNFVGQLVYGRWGKRILSYHCYFITDDGRKIVLPTYPHTFYGPYEEGPSFGHPNSDDNLTATKWYCEYVPTKKGNTKWLIARRVPFEPSDTNES